MVILDSRRRHYLARLSIFLITVALMAGMVGCGGGGVEYDLTIASTVGGSVITHGEGTFTYDEGPVVNLVATPDAGYDFSYYTHWIVNGGDYERRVADIENGWPTAIYSNNFYYPGEPDPYGPHWAQ